MMNLRRRLCECGKLENKVKMLKTVITCEETDNSCEIAEQNELLQNLVWQVSLKTNKLAAA